MHSTNYWNPITEKQKKEILFSKGGYGYAHLKLITGIFVAFILFFLLLLLVAFIVSALSPTKSAFLSDAEIITFALIPLAIFELWLGLTTICYWYAIPVRYFRIASKEVTYQYGVRKGFVMNKYGFLVCVVTLEDGTETQGKLQLCDYSHRGISCKTSDMIAYRIGNDDRVYFSYVMRDKDI